MKNEVNKQEVAHNRKQREGSKKIKGKKIILSLEPRDQHFVSAHDIVSPTELDKTPESNVIPSFSVVFIVCPNWKNHCGFVILSNTVGILDRKSPVELDKTPGSHQKN